MVDTTDTVFWIGDPKPLRITADVDEEDVPRVEPGQKVLLRADAFPDRVLEGGLTSITPKGDPVQKTYRVRIELPDDAPLLIGMTVEANVVVREDRRCRAGSDRRGARRVGVRAVGRPGRATRGPTRGAGAAAGRGAGEARGRRAGDRRSAGRSAGGRRVYVDRGGIEPAVSPVVAAPER